MPETKVKIDFYAAIFDTLVKWWDLCINVVEDMLINKYFPGTNITCLTFISNVTYLLTLPHITIRYLLHSGLNT